MITGKAHTNESFNLLFNSNKFLQKIINNLTSCILLLNENLELQAFNDAITSIFPYTKEKKVLYKKCGNVIGCAYKIDENKDCGETSYCGACDLREASLRSYVNDQEITNKKFIRPFYNDKNEIVEKNLQFSTRLFIFNEDKYVLLIVDEII